ncbi:MAG: phosphatase PAP2 family protein [Candidatus Eisenbacteria bacterium]
MSGRLLATVAAIAAVAFVVLAVLARSEAYFPIDLAITRYVQSLDSALLNLPFRALNVVGFPPIVTILYFVIALAIFLTGRRWEAIGAGIATLGAAALTDLVKILVMRPRPSMDLVNVEHAIRSTGFPAGHVLNITAFVGFLTYLAYVRLAPSWRRTVLIALLVLMIALMGPSLIDAGEHWPSDVLGGYLLGIAWLAMAIGIYQWRKRKKAIESVRQG